MPPLPNAPGVLKIRLVGKLQVSVATWNCVLHARYQGTPPTELDLETLAASIGGLYSANLASLSSPDVTLVEIAVTDLTSATSAQAVRATPVTGTRVGTTMGAQICMVSSWVAQARWRGGHFRSYWPFGVVSDRTNVTTWGQGFRDLAVAGLEAFRVGINALILGGAPVTMVGLSYRTGHALRPNPVPYPITNSLVHPRIDTQRRRLGKETP